MIAPVAGLVDCGLRGPTRREPCETWAADKRTSRRSADDLDVSFACSIARCRGDHVHSPSWRPSSTSGLSDGRTAAGGSPHGPPRRPGGPRQRPIAQPPLSRRRHRRLRPPHHEEKRRPRSPAPSSQSISTIRPCGRSSIPASAAIARGSSSATPSARRRSSLAAPTSPFAGRPAVGDHPGRRDHGQRRVDIAVPVHADLAIDLTWETFCTPTARVTGPWRLSWT